MISIRSRQSSPSLSIGAHRGFARWQSGKNVRPLRAAQGLAQVPPFLKTRNTLPASLSFLGEIFTYKGVSWVASHCVNVLCETCLLPLISASDGASLELREMDWLWDLDA